MLLKLRYYDDPILRKKCSSIEKITEDIKQLAQDMIETMDAANGIGLAAPQIGKSLCMFVMREDNYGPEGDLILGDAKVFINPKLSDPSKETVEFIEGCLSLPGLHIDIVRPRSIYVEAIDLEGNPIKMKFSDYRARVIMHENDHLNGVLFIDRISQEKKNEIKPFLRKIKAKYKALLA